MLDITALLAHAAAEYPREACGLVVRRGAEQVVLPARNLAGAGAFLMDPAALIAARHEVLHALYHSHCDAPATLSAADRAALVVDGEPAWPGVEVWIVPVHRGIPGAPRRFGWRAGDWREEPWS